MANSDKLLISIEPDMDGYSKEEVYENTITVGELKNILKKYSDDAKICLNLADGYYYASM